MGGRWVKRFEFSTPWKHFFHTMESARFANGLP